MARKKKPSGRLNKGPFTYADLDKAIDLDGWYPVDGTKHESYEHATKGGKVSLDKKWTGIKYGHNMFKSVAAQAGLTQQELLKLLNR